MTLSLAKILFTCDFTVPLLIKSAERRRWQTHRNTSLLQLNQPRGVELNCMDEEVNEVQGLARSLIGTYARLIEAGLATLR
jgi:hypothetical protein